MYFSPLLARRFPQLGGGLFDVVGAKGSHVSQALFLDNRQWFLFWKLQERVVQLSNVVVERYVPGLWLQWLWRVFWLLVNVDDVWQLWQEEGEEEGGEVSHQQVAELLRHRQLGAEGGLHEITWDLSEGGLSLLRDYVICAPHSLWLPRLVLMTAISFYIPAKSLARLWIFAINSVTLLKKRDAHKDVETRAPCIISAFLV